MLVKKGIFSNTCIDLSRLKQRIIKIDGKCIYKGVVKLRIFDTGKIVEGFDGIVVGAAKKCVFKGQIENMPLGQSYDIQVWIEDGEGYELEKVTMKKVKIIDHNEALSNHTTVQSQLPPIKLEYIKCKLNPNKYSLDIVIKYSNVIGELYSIGDPLGFSIKIAPRFHETKGFGSIKLKGNKIIIHAWNAYRGINDKDLCYLTYGYPEESNNVITDSVGRLLPTMDLIKITKQVFMTPFVNILRVSPVLSIENSLENLEYPHDLDNYNFATRYFHEWFNDVTEDFRAYEDEKAVIYFRLVLNCEEEMKLTMFLGFEDRGTIKAWANKVPILYYAKTGETYVDFEPEIGLNEILIAFHSTFKNRAGIYIRFARRDTLINSPNLLRCNCKFPLLVNINEKE